jgi:CheY-like chemotaxis protein
MRHVSKPDDLKVQVLLVEDNLTSKLIVQRLLERVGCRVVAVDDGQVAQEQLKQHVYDWVILDQQLPIISGFEIVEQIRTGQLGTLTRNINVLMLSGDEPDDQRYHWLKEHRIVYRVKPISIVDLDRIVKSRSYDELTQ